MKGGSQQIKMDVDVEFPNLSEFVRSKTKKTLTECGAVGGPKNHQLWTLETSCWSVLTERMRWRVDPYQTLKTLDEFIRRLPPRTPTRRIRDKICGKESEFLDTVVEATWALHFWSNGNDVTLEQPLDSNKPKGKNADVVVILNGIRYWLDATSVQLSEQEFPMATSDNPDLFFKMRPSEEVVDKLAEKAKAKYKEKFEPAVHSGRLKNELVGILLCVVKSESIVLPAFDLGRLPPPPPPQGLLDNNRPGLNLVWVHTLNASQDSEVLQPWVFAPWQIT